MSSWLLALLASSQVPYELLALVLSLSSPIHFCMWRCSGGIVTGKFFVVFFFGYPGNNFHGTRIS